MFVKQVNDRRLSRALKNYREGKPPGEDLRGRKPRKIDPAKIAFIEQHINSFPVCESHYTRNDNVNRKYLSLLLNIRRMYDLYKEACLKGNREFVKESCYRHIFNTQFNLHLQKPRKYTCKNCDSYKIKKMDTNLTVEEKAALETTYELHLRKAERARECVKRDSSNPNTEMYVISMDLQKALPFPILTISDAYYKRNLYVYNFGINDMKIKAGYFYYWDEAIAARGSLEIASSLLIHFKKVLSSKPAIKHIVI
ncbi:hypothetical protein ANN_19134 [Periplaneta americana]|uniref:Uncharacterized protein n=1 Tax=Periplaneta americana TaxID=6978 RepID=A0ABQ8S9G7_PERAM|nr:hypothetical protein ANN_19134 [Periplaneta americana]